MSLLKSYSEGKLTTLNTLKYGEVSETDGPIIKKAIPTTVGGSGPKTTQLNARTDDLKRIATILKSGPGLKYLANETALAASAIPSTPGIGGKLAALGKGLVSTTKVIGSTLAQIPLNGTGTHLVKGFVGNSSYTPVLEELYKKSDLNTEPIRRLEPESIPTKDGKYYHGSPGLAGYKRTIEDPYNKGFMDVQVQDQVNLLGPQTGETFESELNDVIKFKFTILSSDSRSQDVHLQFRAYLDSLNDNYSGAWNSFNYVGRGEQFHTYNSFQRGISFGFKIAAQTRKEMRPLYQKLVYLASSTAPTYSGQGYMRGTLAKITIGDYIYDMPGFFETITYAWEKEYPWEIVSDRVEKDFDQQQLPMVLNCTATFKPIHKFIPQTGFYNYITGGDFASQAFFVPGGGAGDTGKPLGHESGITPVQTQTAGLTPLELTGPQAPLLRQLPTAAPVAGIRPVGGIGQISAPIFTG